MISQLQEVKLIFFLSFLYHCFSPKSHRSKVKFIFGSIFKLNISVTREYFLINLFLLSIDCCQFYCFILYINVMHGTHVLYHESKIPISVVLAILIDQRRTHLLTIRIVMVVFRPVFFCRFPPPGTTHHTKPGWKDTTQFHGMPSNMIAAKMFICALTNWEFPFLCRFEGDKFDET